MRHLTILYDPRCPLCEWASSWLSGLDQLVPIEFVAAKSDEARRRFIDVDHESTWDEITAVDDEGNVYTGEKAWVAALWCTRRYRSTSQRLANPTLLPLTRRFVRLVSKYRRVDECEDGVCGAG